MSAKHVIGATILGFLAGIGFATLFVYFMTGACVP
jgi:hypothetical protein